MLITEVRNGDTTAETAHEQITAIVAEAKAAGLDIEVGVTLEQLQDQENADYDESYEESYEESYGDDDEDDNEDDEDDE